MWVVLRVTTAKLPSCSRVKPCTCRVWVGTTQPDHPQSLCRAGSSSHEVFNVVVSCAKAEVSEKAFCRGESRFSVAVAVCSNQLPSSNIPSVFQILILYQPLLLNFSKGYTQGAICQVCGIRDNLLMALFITAALFGKLSVAYAECVQYFKYTNIIALLLSR